MRVFFLALFLVLGAIGSLKAMQGGLGNPPMNYGYPEGSLSYPEPMYEYPGSGGAPVYPRAAGAYGYPGHRPHGAAYPGMASPPGSNQGFENVAEFLAEILYGLYLRAGSQHFCEEGKDQQIMQHFQEEYRKKAKNHHKQPPKETQESMDKALDWIGSCYNYRTLLAFYRELMKLRGETRSLDAEIHKSFGSKILGAGKSLLGGVASFFKSVVKAPFEAVSDVAGAVEKEVKSMVGNNNSNNSGLQPPPQMQSPGVPFQYAQGTQVPNYNFNQGKLTKKERKAEKREMKQQAQQQQLFYPPTYQQTPVY